MSDAAFKVGQIVAFGRGAGDGHIRGNAFTVTRVMPLESGFRSYRVRGQDGVERAFQENQLRLADTASQAGKNVEVWPT